MVHSPFELPISKTFTEFSYKQQINVWITPEVIEAEDDLRSFDPDERKCYFEDERSLKYFKIYTQKNCEMECLSFIGEC
jgi:amiloride-sensitive sodium channel